MEYGFMGWGSATFRIKQFKKEKKNYTVSTHKNTFVGLFLKVFKYQMYKKYTNVKNIYYWNYYKKTDLN